MNSEDSACIRDAAISHISNVGNELYEAAEKLNSFAVAYKLMEPASVKDDDRRLCERLSPRELVVASMMVQGLHAKEIAHRMGIKYKTVHSFRRRIHTHLNVRNDIQAVRVLMAGGITGTQPEGSTP